MTHLFFEKPILNSPYDYPSQHWELDESGQPTQKIIAARRYAKLTTPIPKSKKHTGNNTQDIGADTMFVGRFAGQLNERESQLSFCRKVTVKQRPAVATFHYRPRALICKPHGSLDWYARAGRPVFYPGDLVDAVRLIITPGHNKFRNGYDSPFDHHRSKANDAIDRASRFLVLGYGFNDDHLETHLSPCIKGGKPTLMLTRSLSTVARQLALMHANVIALEYGEVSGVAGTTVIVEQTEFFFPGVGMWDINSFVTEVLEP